MDALVYSDVWYLLVFAWTEMAVETNVTASYRASRQRTE
jgi:hypothetical protein